MKLRLLLPAVVALLTLASGCSTLGPPRSALEEDPNVRVDRILTRFKATLERGVACADTIQGGDAPVDCEGLLREARQLYTAYPHHERVILLAALLSQQSGRADQAAFLLDQLLAGERPRPEAAVLRSRLAIEGGNLTLARAVLTRQIQLNPQHYPLHETLAAAHYLDRDAAAALHALAMAERLGAPGWRIAYHRGLLLEHQARYPAACRQYRLAAGAHPGFAGPEGRLMALAATGRCPGDGAGNGNGNGNGE